MNHFHKIFPLTSLICGLLSLLPCKGQVDLWDLPPLRYSDQSPNDALSKLAADWQSGAAKLTGRTALERVQEVLRALKISATSQVLVYSKTSKQNGLIHPGNPRALFFSRDCYAGYVPGGVMEIIINDAKLGQVFYLIELGNESRAPKVERDTSDCLSCHGTGRTENVPGVLIRSVFPDEDGHPLLSFGSGVITHETPIPERWGGYYVTGSIALPHLGNRTYADGRKAEAATSHWESLDDHIDVKKYPVNTSDVVALMVLEHQCHAHNLLTAASMNYHRACFLSKSIDPDGDPDQGSAGRVADQAAQRIVEWFLFKTETEMGDDGVEGSEAFQREFAAVIPRAKNGDSLADFQLNTRLFKNRCSYMIYSDAFNNLPPTVKTKVLTRLKNVLDATSCDDDFPTMKLSERRRIASILRDTGIF